MAFRLRPDESIAHGLRRLARKELASAADILRKTDPPEEASIHDARTHVKKARAIFELVRADEGHGLDGSAKRLRSVNRALSRLRDADAMLEILTTLRKEAPDVLSAGVATRVRRQLVAHKRAVMKRAGKKKAWNDAVKELRKLRRVAKAWQPDHRDFRALAAGLRQSHRRGRKAKARAVESGRAADFHEWRKQMKALWYELRLVEPCGARIRRDAGVLRRTQRWLGDDHNIVVLCEELSQDASICGGAADLDRIRLAADRYQCGLRQKAIDETKQLYARKPGAYVRGIQGAWKKWTQG